MKQILPQEVEVWYLIPALRKEIAINLIKKKELSQKEAADILGITESAVSQYVSMKRASAVKFNKEEKKKIEKTAEMLVKDRKNKIKHLDKLIKSFKKSGSMCEIHKKYEKVDKTCDICLK